MGSTAIYTSTSVDAATNDKFSGTLELTVLNAGASAKVYGWGMAATIASSTMTPRLLKRP